MPLYLALKSMYVTFRSSRHLTEHTRVCPDEIWGSHIRNYVSWDMQLCSVVNRYQIIGKCEFKSVSFVVGLFDLKAWNISIVPM
jgi:hypothetical protein